ESLPEVSRLLHLATALLHVRRARCKRLECCRLAHGVMQPLREVARLLGGLPRGGGLAADLERDRACRHRLDRLCDQPGALAHIERPVELGDRGAVIPAATPRTAEARARRAGDPEP